MDQNKVLKGNKGKVWLNGKLLSGIKSIEAKVTLNFEEVNVCDENGTFNVYTGWSGEGSVTMTKTDNTVLKLMKDCAKTGIMPEIKIITSLTDVSTGKSERVAIYNIVINEFMLTKFEAKAINEEEIPFKFSSYDVLETI